MLDGKAGSLSSGGFWILRVLSKVTVCLEQSMVTMCLEQCTEGLKLLLHADQVCHRISLVRCRWVMRSFQNLAMYQYGESEDLWLQCFRKIPSLLSECSMVFSQRAADLHVGGWLQGDMPLRKANTLMPADNWSTGGWRRSGKLWGLQKIKGWKQQLLINLCEAFFFFFVLWSKYILGFFSLDVLATSLIFQCYIW